MKIRHYTAMDLHVSHTTLEAQTSRGQRSPQPIEAAIGVYFCRVQGILPPVGLSNEART